MHAGFYLSPHTVSIGLIGPGIGRQRVARSDRVAGDRLHRDFRLDLRLRGILTSKKMLLADTRVRWTQWRDALAAAAAPADLRRSSRTSHAAQLPHAVIIDCSASADDRAALPAWLAAGIHVVTPNKQASSADLGVLRALAEARRVGGAHYLYEATVGAGLPIIQTLRDLRETGDRDPARSKGSCRARCVPVQRLGRQAAVLARSCARRKAQGYTEPDPRDDLSGTDVARKLIILGARDGHATGAGGRASSKGSCRSR